MIIPYYHKASSILICENTFSFLEKMKDNSIDMIFADPPYYDPQFPTIKNLCKRLKTDGILILSQPKELENFESEKLVLINEKLYSGAKILFFKTK